MDELTQFLDTLGKNYRKKEEEYDLLEIFPKDFFDDENDYL